MVGTCVFGQVELEPSAFIQLKKLAVNSAPALAKPVRASRLAMCYVILQKRLALHHVSQNSKLVAWHILAWHASLRQLGRPS